MKKSLIVIATMLVVGCGDESETMDAKSIPAPKAKDMEKEPDIEPVAEPDIEPVAEPDIEPVAEPDIEPVAEPDIEPVAERKYARFLNALAEGKKQTIVTYGTSLTASGVWVSQMQEWLDGDYPNLAHVVNSGQGGMASSWGVSNLEEKVLSESPHVVFIEFSMNDAFISWGLSVEQARTNLEIMVGRILTAIPGSEIILMVMNIPIGEHHSYRPHIDDYYKMYRDYAASHELLLIDHYPNWKAILDSNPDLYAEYVPDGIHPNEAGCSSIITPVIIKELSKHKEK